MESGMPRSNGGGWDAEVVHHAWGDWDAEARCHARGDWDAEAEWRRYTMLGAIGMESRCQGWTEAIGTSRWYTMLGAIEMPRQDGKRNAKVGVVLASYAEWVRACRKLLTSRVTL